LERATGAQAAPDFPVFKSRPGALPITSEDVARALHGEDVQNDKGVEDGDGT
jgi:hypothetical protein